MNARVILVALLVACGGGDDPEHANPDAGVDAAIARDAAPDAPDVPWPAVTRTGGVIAISERHAFCLELTSCGGELTYQQCRDAVDDTTTVQFAIAGCQSDARLEAAIACTGAHDYCSSTACDAAIEAWATSYASAACESDVYSVGIGDRFPIGASDSTCDGGIRAAGGWCTRACSTAATCAGSGPNGKNHFGTANTCGHDSLPQGFGCYPTCTSTAHCQAWFGERREGLRIACKRFDDGSAPEPICVRVIDDRGVELP